MRCPSIPDEEQKRHRSIWEWEERDNQGWDGREDERRLIPRLREMEEEKKRREDYPMIGMKMRMDRASMV